MQNRRDQVQAHAFVAGRLVSALLRAEPDSPMTPLRRFLVGTVCGILLGGLAVAGFGVYGIFSPGGDTSWQQPGVLVIEKETGARYVVVDNVLRPVVNYVSARLILGGDKGTVSVSRSSLSGYPHGLPVGIVTAPEYLPDRQHMGGGKWQVCSVRAKDSTGAAKTRVTVRIGQTPALEREAGRDEGMLLRAPSGELYLLWNNRRLRLPAPELATALGYSAVPVVTVGWQWLNALPVGPDLRVAQPPLTGTAGPRINGVTSVVGQLYRVTGGATADQYFVMRSDGLSPLSALGAALLLADPGTQAGYPQGKVSFLDIAAAQLPALPASAISSVDAELPAAPPKPMLLQSGEAPCVELTMGPQGPQARSGVLTVSDVDSAKVPEGDGVHADQMLIAPGTGLLVRQLPGPGVADGALYLLTDNGLRYPIPNEGVAEMLGYGDMAATAVPLPVLDLVPTGPPLDPDAAHETVQAPAPTASPGRDAADRPA